MTLVYKPMVYILPKNKYKEGERASSKFIEVKNKIFLSNQQ